MKTFYRVCNPNTQQGLWYDFEGNFTGLIHDKFSFCANSELEMDFDPELVGWLSATDNYPDLLKWFPEKDILELQKDGWHVHTYETENYRLYERFQHYVICQKNKSAC
jgi:hypothetical protein